MTAFLQMSLAGGGMVMTTALLRLVFRDRLPRAAYLCLWGAALVRLLSPVMFASPCSIFALLNRSGGLTAPVDAVSPAAANLAGAETGWVLWAAWLSGALVCAVWLIGREIHARRALRDAQPVDNETARAILTQFGIRRRVRIRTHMRVRSPMTYGVLRPVVMLPMTGMQDDALRFALLHELCHIKRLDCLWKTLAALAACAHWFNPCVWLLSVLLSRDLEIACDRQVLRCCPGDRRAAYAHALLDFAERNLSFSPLASHFSKNPLEERILCMMNCRKSSIAGITLATALVLGTTSAFAASVNTTPAKSGSVFVASSADDAMKYNVETEAVDGEVSYSYTVTVEGEDVDNPTTYSLDDANRTVLPDGTVQYTLENGIVITLVTEGVALAETN